MASIILGPLCSRSADERRWAELDLTSKSLAPSTSSKPSSLDDGYLALFVDTAIASNTMAWPAEAPQTAEAAPSESAQEGGGQGKFLDAMSFIGIIAEPISRPQWLHEYHITSYSIGVAVAHGFTAAEIATFLARHATAPAQVDDVDLDATVEPGMGSSIPSLVRRILGRPIWKFIERLVLSHRRARTVMLQGDSCVVECADEATALKLRMDSVIKTQASGDVQKCDATADSRRSALLQRLMATVTSRPGGATTAASLKTNSGGVTAAASKAMETTNPNASFQAAYMFPLVDVVAAKYVAKQAERLGIPLTQQYDFAADTVMPNSHLELKHSAQPRPYQVQAVRSAVSGGRCSSGVIVLPCGSGKTLVGILLMCAVNKPTVICCASAVSVEQWLAQIHEYATINADSNGNNNNSHAVTTSAIHNVAEQRSRIACMTGKRKDPITASTEIVIVTYSMVATAHRMLQRHQQAAAVVAATTSVGASDAAASGRRPNQTSSFSRHPASGLFRDWGLLLLDEAHVVPAEYYQKSLAAIKARATIGLTATYVREDDGIMELRHFIGPKLCDVSAEELRRDGFLATVYAVEVRCLFSPEFSTEYIRRTVAPPTKGTAAPDPMLHQADKPVLSFLAACNPVKMLCAAQLLLRHANAKVLLFCDQIALLKEFSRVLRIPMICGETSHKDRMKMFSDFQCTTAVNALLVSRVGDVSVNLPCASVVIQISSHGGSRRQEAQRLGRVLRPKGSATKPGEGTSSSNVAYFYTLVSDDTSEVYYASKRLQFLRHQGYRCGSERFDPDLRGMAAPSLREPTSNPAGDSSAKLEPVEATTTTTVKEPPITATIKDEKNVVVRPVATAQAAAASPAGSSARVSLEERYRRLLVDVTSHVCDASKRVTWLGTVVSHWEVAFQELRAGKKRRRSGTGEMSSDSDGLDFEDSADDDDVREAIRTPRQGSVAITTTTRVRTLAELTTGGEDLVYVEPTTSQAPTRHAMVGPSR